MENPDILKKHPLSLQQIIALLFFAISTTFGATKIYDRFQLMEAEQKLEKEYVREELTKLNIKIDDVYHKNNERTTKITKRNLDRIEQLEEEKIKIKPAPWQPIPWKTGELK